MSSNVTVRNEAIVALADGIARQFHPERIVLFGSYAYGEPNPESDVDLLVVLPFEGSPFKKAVEILNQLDPPFSVDLIVQTPERLRQRIEWNDFFLKEVIERGKVLYEPSYD